MTFSLPVTVVLMISLQLIETEQEMTIDMPPHHQWPMLYDLMEAPCLPLPPEIHTRIPSPNILLSMSPVTRPTANLQPNVAELLTGWLRLPMHSL